MIERCFEWRCKIPKKDELLYEKREAIEVAVELCYSDPVLERIICAVTELEISNILRNARLQM